MKLKKTYSYALWSAVYLTIVSVGIAAISYFILSEHLGYSIIIISIIALFLTSFLLFNTEQNILYIEG
ncbi:hypothetical protein N5A56_012125 [Polaribacter sp. MSW5]|uniref:Uncharacterized protein n=1 Tax=Polaribacter ponticola TaxID=2978475 RepID=A0ABT5SAH5_9FLAO|nr:hypothetical protein [Polaribacter sp. MSW5]MDD7915112.1 hypothetical protein [Polaribacter sp. MSW5]